MDDLISRQAAIDILSLGKEILSRVLDDMDVVGTDREKYSWGLGLIETNIKDIEELPSAQTEIIRCKDCRFQDKGRNESEYWNLCRYRPWLHVPTEDEHYCGYAERRTGHGSD